MKLLLCQECQDVFSLHMNPRHCRCGKTAGRYVNNVDATVTGPCFVLGFDNHSLIDALMRHRMGRRDDNMGWVFEAFVIPENAASVKRA